ncbi:MAG: thioredoxin domain-containing protein [Solirubrobacterales bacterium]
MASRKEQKEEARLAREAKEQQHAADAAKKRRLSIIGGVVGLALLAVVIAVVVSASSNSGTSTSSDAKTVNARYANIPQDGVTLGEPAAKATIVEFADLRCPYCKDFEEGSMPTIVDELIKTGKAKLVFRNLTILDAASPSGKDSTNAAQYAAATSLQNKMFPFINLFYLNQQPENTDYVTESFLKGIANQITGLNADEAWTNRSNPKATNELSKADEQGQDLGVSGTPTIFVGKDEDSLEKVDLSDLTNPQPIIDAVNNLQ